MSSCESCKYEMVRADEEPCDYCVNNEWAMRTHDEVENHYEERKTTRYDKIMQDMTVEKMAEMLTEYSTGDDDYWYENDAGKWHELSSAIQAEIEWLKGASE